MVVPLLGAMLGTLLLIVLALLGCLMIFIILLQRGRGGGLAGAFGGLGGQSAFGTKAGDVFTKITAAMAIVWVILAGASGLVLRAGSAKFKGDPPEQTQMEGRPGDRPDPDFRPDDEDDFLPQNGRSLPDGPALPDFKADPGQSGSPEQKGPALKAPDQKTPDSTEPDSKAPPANEPDND